MPLETSTAKSDKACMDCHKQESLHRNYLKKVYLRQDTGKARSRQDKHDWRPISFTLVVNDFGVKYIGKEHVHHLIQTLKQHYELEEDWGGTRYLGIMLDWN
jgi:hypothetical protein